MWKARSVRSARNRACGQALRARPTPCTWRSACCLCCHACCTSRTVAHAGFAYRNVGEVVMLQVIVGVAADCISQIRHVQAMAATYTHTPDFLDASTRAHTWSNATSHDRVSNGTQMSETHICTQSTYTHARVHACTHASMHAQAYKTRTSNQADGCQGRSTHARYILACLIAHKIVCG